MAPEISEQASSDSDETNNRSESLNLKARSGPGQPTEQVWQSHDVSFQMASLLEDNLPDWEDEEFVSDQEGTE